MSAVADAAAAPVGPSAAASGIASPRRTAAARMLSARSSPVNPAMTSTNATPPVATFTVCPTSMIRSGVDPTAYPGPKASSACGAATKSTIASGSVAANAQRVARLKRLSSRSRWPRACRSAANGEKTRFTEVRKSRISCEIRAAAA